MAAAEPRDARRWLERAHRLVPEDGLVALTLGAVRLLCGDAAGAVRLLAPLAAAVPAAAAGLATAQLALGVRGEVPRGAGSVLQGIVREEGSGLGGWAWCPGDPEGAVALVASGPGGTRALVAAAVLEGVEGLPPLARPRRFALSAAECDALGSPIMVADAAGRALPGSPVWRGVVAPVLPAEAARIDRRARAVDVVVPVYGATAETATCLRAVLATVPAGTVVHVVDDGSPESGGLAGWAADGRIRLHRHGANRGFPAAANTGLRAAAGRDAVLLNSDTVVSPGWLERLRAAAYSAPEVGSATPLSGDGSIVSYEGKGTAGELDALVREVLAGEVAALPVGVGFCLFLRRDCLDQVGLLREDVFAQGYGEESEFCLRARRCGWRHVAALDVFVGHRGGVSFKGSFGGTVGALRRRNQAVLERLHPGYPALVAGFLRADPLFPARRRIAAAQWAAERTGAAAVLVSHGEGGGVAELVAARAAAWRRAGVRPVVLVPAAGGCRVEGWDDLRFAVPAAGGCRVEGWDDLRFAVPGELGLLAGLLREDGVRVVERHHTLGHVPEVLALAGLLGVPVETWVHDASLFCPRVALIGAGRWYCGEPAVSGCEACVAALGSRLGEPIGVAALVARSGAELAGSRRVVVPTADGARRVRRHFPGVRPVVEPLEDDGALPPLERRAAGGAMRVVVVGAIGAEKGYDVLLACAADARERALPLEFVVCGRTEDDERLMAAGPAFVTGRFEAGEAVELIRAQEGHIAFIPSIWPEVWCFALSRAWEAGLPAVAFDLGAPAERIRATGRGWVLPLGLPAAGVNDALLRLASGWAGLQPSAAPLPD